jgi:two-component sensor histidine kinase
MPQRGKPPLSPSADVELAASRARIAELEQQLAQAGVREAQSRSELQHRVRNVLAVIRSVFSRTMATGGSAEDLVDHFHGRLEAISRYQSFWLSTGQVSIELDDLVREELRSFQFGDDPAITIDGSSVLVGLEVAQLIALAVQELVTNSLKFGVLTGNHSRGRLSIRWAQSGDSARFEWTETGVAILSAAPPRYGFGREFIEQALPYQVNATSAFELRPGGLTCIITFPLDAVASHMI